MLGFLYNCKERLLNIRDKVVVVVGGASGLGLATANDLIERGACVVVLDLDLERTVEISKQLGVNAYPCDVTSESDVRRAIAQIVQVHGRVDVCVNCAGILSVGRLVSREGPFPFDDFSRVIQVNLTGTFNVMRLVAEQMMSQVLIEGESDRGVIVNTASVAAYEGQVGQVAYSASKGGVIAMTLPVAREMAKYAIRVMTIAPGIMETPMMASLSSAAQDQLNESVPYPKRMGRPSEFAHTVGHIIENSYLNGSVIRLDGAIRLS